MLQPGHIAYLHFVHYISTYCHQDTGGLQIQNNLYRFTASLTYIFNFVNYISISFGLIKLTEHSGKAEYYKKIVDNLKNKRKNRAIHSRLIYTPE